MKKDYWKEKKVLVTGHTGFVGAWLCMALMLKGANVIGFSLREEEGALYEKIKNNLNIRSIYGDLRDSNAIGTVVNEVRPEIIFHIAAFGFVKECFDDPKRAYSSNVDGTLNLFEAIREVDNQCRIVVASSDKVYKNSDLNTYLFKEGDPLGGSDPYSASKTCEDILSQSFFDTYLNNRKHSLCIVRPSNILGGGDHNINRLIPSIYYNLGQNRQPEIRNPNSVRPWQNILDIVDAYLTVAERVEEGCKIYNVGPEPGGIKTVGEIVAYVSELYNFNMEERNMDKLEIKEKAYLGLSIDKIKTELDWKPRRSLDHTLNEIYEFYNMDNGINTYDLCAEQINNYYTEEEQHEQVEQ